MRAGASFAFAILLATALPPAAGHAGVKVVADPESRSRPEGYWYIRKEAADFYDGRARLLLSKFPTLANGPAPLGREAPLLRGNYFIYPICPQIGIWPAGRQPAKFGDPPVRLKCP